MNKKSHENLDAVSDTMASAMKGVLKGDYDVGQTQAAAKAAGRVIQSEVVKLQDTIGAGVVVTHIGTR